MPSSAPIVRSSKCLPDSGSLEAHRHRSPQGSWAVNALQLVEPFARRQHGLFTREQALSAGVPSSTLTELAFTRRVEREWHGVYRFNVFPKTWEQRALVPLLASTTPVLLSHRAAAYMLGFAGCPRPVSIDVVAGRSVIFRIPGVKVHRVRHLPQQFRVRGFACTSPDDTLLSLAAVLATDTLALAFDSAHRQYPTHVEQLFQRLQSNDLRGVKGVTQLRQLFQTRRGAVLESPLESKLFTALLRANVPRPRTQHIVRDTANRYVMRVDFAWVDKRIALHADGFSTHAGRLAFDDDAEKRSALAALGWLNLTVTSESMKRGTWLEHLRAALRQRELKRAA